MPSNDSNDRFELAARRVEYSNGARYRARGEFLFRGMSFIAAHVLEVGCGCGTWAIWAALHGANRVVGIDPEAHGSSAGTFAGFQETIKKLDLTQNVTPLACRLDQLPLQNRPFDIVIMYNVINHLNEEAVMAMHYKADARQSYVNLLTELRPRIRCGGICVVADCGRDNLWHRLGLRSPLAPYTAWRKHQSPKMWVEVFERAGFKCTGLRWSPLYPFGRLTANWITQYITYSHFVLRFEAV